MGRYVLGVSGASGIILAKVALKNLLESGHEVECVITPSALYTASLELGCSTSAELLGSYAKHPNLRVHPIYDMGSAIASGSYPIDGMLVIPCSMATLAAIACGLSDNVLRRAADVTLKERRPLIIVPRETPLSEIHLENMLKLVRMGASILPPMPAWYTMPKTLEDIENFVVGKALDLLKISNSIYPRWKN